MSIPVKITPPIKPSGFLASSSIAQSSDSVQTGSNNYEAQDSWCLLAHGGNFYNANKPTNANLQLPHLFSSYNTDDIASVRARIPGGGRTNITFASRATNSPIITIGSGS